MLDIRSQVDNLLDFSIADSQRPVELDASMDVEYIFGDYLSDVCAQLMKSNYEVDAEGISFKQVKVAVNMAFLTRIFSNLTDNIYKYADNKKPMDDLFEDKGRIAELFGYAVQFELSMPGRVVSTNAAMQIGESLIWKVDAFRLLDSDYMLAAESRVVNYWAFGITLLLILLIGGYCWRLYRKLS